MHNQTFAFESDFVESLRCIPMAVRFKLDTIGIKLTLRQWSGLSRADRQALLDMDCQPGTQVGSYRARLVEMLQRSGLGSVKDLALGLAVHPPEGPPPEQVEGFARQVGLGGISRVGWDRLDALQRFALVKLSRDNHDNVNFIPALQEFGLL